MMATCEVLSTVGQRPLREAFAADVRRGLSGRPKSLSSAYFYDARGSQLFEEITRLDEYYLTRCEREILLAHSGELARLLEDHPFRVVEVGAGDGHKTEIMLRQFLQQGFSFEYVPTDICRRSIVELVGKLRQSLTSDALRVRGIVAEYNDALASLPPHDNVRNLVLFLGSSIGNFTHAESLQFLRGLRASLNRGDLALIGFDLKKDVQVLQRAYDDREGVTREFNFNLLDRINRELGGEFDRGNFRHHAFYNANEGCMESWLVSRCHQRIAVDAVQRCFDFQTGEGMRVERSYKYSLARIHAMAVQCGFRINRHMFDLQHRFVDSLWEAC